MHAAGRKIENHPSAAGFRQSSGERLPPLGVELAHAPYVAREMPFLDEGGDDRLDERRRRRMQGGAGGGKAFRQRLRNHEIADTQGGKENLAERADIEHAIAPIDALEGGQRPTAIAE